MATNNVDNKICNEFINVEDSIGVASDMPNYELIFTQHLENEKREFSNKIASLHIKLEERERYILSEFDRLSIEIREQIVGDKGQLDKVSSVIADMHTSLRENMFQQLVETSQKPLMDTLNQYKRKMSLLCQDFKLKISLNEIETNIEQIGTIERPKIINFGEEKSTTHSNQDEKVNQIPYADRKIPIWSTGCSGSCDECINGTRGLAISPITNNIYVSDYSGNRIQVFSSEGEHIKAISHPDIVGIFYIVFSNYDANIIYLTSRCHLCSFNVDGNILNKIETPKNLFRGMDVNIDDVIYACSVLEHKLYCYKTPELELIETIQLNTVEVEKRRKLMDIKLFENKLYALFSHDGVWFMFSQTEFPLQEFDLKGNHIRSLLSGLILPKPLFFFIDNTSRNILITEYCNNVIVVMTIYGDKMDSLLGSNEVVKPSGVAVDKLGKVIVCSNGKSTNILQAF